jgi:hypothetical protein
MQASSVVRSAPKIVTSDRFAVRSERSVDIIGSSRLVCLGPDHHHREHVDPLAWLQHEQAQVADAARYEGWYLQGAGLPSELVFDDEPRRTNASPSDGALLRP